MKVSPMIHLTHIAHRPIASILILSSMVITGVFHGCKASPPKELTSRDAPRATQAEAPPQVTPPKAPAEVIAEDEAPTAPRTERAIEEIQPTLYFVREAVESERVTINLMYHRNPTHPAPRAVELWVEFDEGIELDASEALESTLNAQKFLIVQKTEPGLIRVIIYGTNLNRLDSGALAKLTFKASPFPNSLIHFRETSPIFAPMEANQNFLLGAPLSLKGEN